MARLELAKNLLYSGRSREAIPVLLPALKVEDQNTPIAMMFLVQAYVNTGDRATARKYPSKPTSMCCATGQRICCRRSKVI